MSLPNFGKEKGREKQKGTTSKDPLPFLASSLSIQTPKHRTPYAVYAFIFSHFLFIHVLPLQPLDGSLVAHIRLPLIALAIVLVPANLLVLALPLVHQRLQLRVVVLRHRFRRHLHRQVPA